MIRRKLYLSTEVLRTLAFSPPAATASRGAPCHSRRCSDGEPCNDSRETCP
jgi:hypothetical protein